VDVDAIDLRAQPHHVVFAPVSVSRPRPSAPLEIRDLSRAHVSHIGSQRVTAIGKVENMRDPAFRKAPAKRPDHRARHEELLGETARRQPVGQPETPHGRPLEDHRAGVERHGLHRERAVDQHLRPPAHRLDKAPCQLAAHGVEGHAAPHLATQALQRVVEVRIVGGQNVAQPGVAHLLAPGRRGARR
jgi:hypothetical protein